MLGKEIHKFYKNKLGLIMKPITITDSNFEEEVIKSNVPVLVDFWAVWCGPCKAIAPVVESLAVEYDGKVKVGKLDVDQNNDTAIKYGVRAIPTLLIFKQGKLINTIMGNVPKSQIVEALNSVLS